MKHASTELVERASHAIRTAIFLYRHVLTIEIDIPSDIVRASWNASASA